MAKLINKNGLEIQHAAKPVFDELMRGSGCVVGEKGSLFIENENYGEKNIVVFNIPDATGTAISKKFPAGGFKEAWELFSSFE